MTGGWDRVLRELLALPPRTPLIVPRRPRSWDNVLVFERPVGHPSEHGARSSYGLPKGQDADWRWTLPDGRSLHVLEYPDRFVGHIDEVDPSTGALAHLRRDAPAVPVTAAAGAGAVAGAVVGLVFLGPLGTLIAAFTGALASARAAAGWTLAGRADQVELAHQVDEGSTPWTP